MRIAPVGQAELSCDASHPAPRHPHRLFLHFSLVALSLLLTGCETCHYYAQAVRGQCQMWNRQRSIESLLNDPSIAGPLKERLRLVLEIRAFAEAELQLPANGHYLRYADLERRFAVWNVYAAPEFSLTPKSWWYPVVGQLEYRGYFSEKAARRYAAKLEKRGLDVYVGGVTAYSTLGWFRDPVLNTFVHDADADLAELLFHELAHQRLFVPGDTDFNEAFATTVAEEGVRRWIRTRRDPAIIEEYQSATHRTEQFVQIVAQARDQLKAVYDGTGAEDGSANPEKVVAMRAAKQRVIAALRENYARLKAAWGGNGAYDAWFQRSLNNAQLNTVDTYYHLVPAFRRLLREQGGDLARFFEAAESLGRLKEEERQVRLNQLRAAPVARD
jgi:predicted aminopeptidase